MRVLITAPRLDPHGVGEAALAKDLLREMAPLVDLTVLAFEPPNGPALSTALEGMRVVSFTEPNAGLGGERFAAMLKLHVFSFNRMVRDWLNETGERFDLAHSILPAAPRYPTPLRHFDMPYIIGPVGGALPTPKAFAGEMSGAQWFTRLRALDGLRFSYDPVLRASYEKAAAVLGVAPYMEDVLSAMKIRRFEPCLGIGLDEVPAPIARNSTAGQFKMIQVGRVVRNKGLRDSIRALALLKDLPGVTLTVAGDGEDLPQCKAEAEALGVADRVTFLGALPRAEVEQHYKTADALLFPSFRESMGAVLYEAMRWGLPAITVGVGGPDYIVDDQTGLKVPLTTPQQMPRDLSDAIRKLAVDVELRHRLGDAGREKVLREALWPAKARRMVELYDSILGDQAQRR